MTVQRRVHVSLQWQMGGLSLASQHVHKAVTSWCIWGQLACILTTAWRHSLLSCNHTHWLASSCPSWGRHRAASPVEAPDGADLARTLTASKGQSPMSAKNSAEAEPARKRMVWYLAAISGPAFSAYKLHATTACHL